MSVNQETLQQLKDQLKEAKAVGMPVKSDIQDHLIELFTRIMLHNPKNAYDKFEEISALVKETNYKIKDPSKDDVIVTTPQSIRNAQIESRIRETIENIKALLEERPDTQGASDKILITNNKLLDCVLPNFVDQAQIFEAAGIGFGEENHYLIQKSLQRLAYLSQAKKLRFFGKILCTQKDYWIAEGIIVGKEEEIRNPAQEVRGKGANELVFWATNNLMNDWIQLPDVEPEQIKLARNFKKLLTGNLNSPVDSNPRFPGKERHLLRAQLARITHSCHIIPKGLYEIDEETQEQKFAEEGPAMDTENLRNLENWSHGLQILLKAGRCSHQEPVGLDDEAKEEYMNKLNEEDKVEERFKIISEDSQVPGQGPAWISKVAGDTQPYNKISGEGTVSYAVNIISSQRWPGAVTCSKGGQFCSIYVGDLMKRGDANFNPTEPPEIMADPKEPSDIPEPQGKFEEPKPPAEEVEND